MSEQQGANGALDKEAVAIAGGSAAHAADVVTGAGSTGPETPAGLADAPLGSDAPVTARPGADDAIGGGTEPSGDAATDEETAGNKVLDESDWRRLTREVRAKADGEYKGKDIPLDLYANKPPYLTPDEYEDSILRLKAGKDEERDGAANTTLPGNTVDYGDNQATAGTEPEGEVPGFLRDDAPLSAGARANEIGAHDAGWAPVKNNGKTGTAADQTTRPTDGPTTADPAPAQAATADATDDLAKYGRQVLDGIRGMAVTAAHNAPRALGDGAYVLGRLIGRIGDKLDGAGNGPTDTPDSGARQ